MQQDQSDVPRARVFISCGQSKGSDEVVIASQIRDRLEKLGFDPYIAVEEQTLLGLTENIFQQLGKSEYFVFVDFKRERLTNTVTESQLRHKVAAFLKHTERPVYRGSLFSHQELAIASYLGIEVLAFQESGVKNDDGILRFLQANSIPFRDRHLLPNVVADQVQQRGWNARWKNELVLERNPAQYEVLPILRTGSGPS